jgi:DNA repair photolyase
MILRPFDPWKSPLCTCPPKLSLNPYTGCPHGCLYCYAASYIPRFQECRPKSDLHKRLLRELGRVLPGSLIAMSNSSDPYPFMERELELSRWCLRILKEKELSVQVVTKSDLITRDIDLISAMKSTAAITLTTLSEDLSQRLEPRAPLPGRRLEAIRILSDRGVPVSARIDPIIPGLNDLEMSDAVKAACQAGAKHIISSTFKASPLSLGRICRAFPREGKRLQNLYNSGSRRHGHQLLPSELRMRLMHEVRKAAIREGATFSCCREGLSPEKAVRCDGSHLIMQ